MKQFLPYIYVFTSLLVTTICHTSAAPTTPSNSKNSPTATDSSAFTTLPTFADFTTFLPLSDLSKTREDHPSTALAEKSPEKVTSQRNAQNVEDSGSSGGSVKFSPSQDNFHALPEYQQPIPGFEPAVPASRPHPLDLRGPFAVVYPVEDVGDGDMALAESNIVFTPLFTYRLRTEHRRRVYYQPSFVRSSRSGYSDYPDYYNNAHYDYVS